jgi:hypothetical protein
MLMSDFKMEHPNKSFGNPLDIHGVNIFEPPITALIPGYPLISLCNLFIFMGQTFLHKTLSMVIHGYPWNPRKYLHILPSLFLCKDLEVGCLVDM